MIRNTFLIQICGVTSPQIGRLLPRVLQRIRFLLKTWKASSEKCWVCAYLNLQKNGVALLADLRPSVSAFRSSAFALVTEFRTNNLNRGINFKDTHRSAAPALDNLVRTSNSPM